MPNCHRQNTRIRAFCPRSKCLWRIRGAIPWVLFTWQQCMDSRALLYQFKSYWSDIWSVGTHCSIASHFSSCEGVPIFFDVMISLLSLKVRLSGHEEEAHLQIVRLFSQVVLPRLVECCDGDLESYTFESESENFGFEGE